LIVAAVERFLPHRFISELDFRPRKLSVLPLATEIRDRVRPLSTPAGSEIRWSQVTKDASRVHQYTGGTHDSYSFAIR